MTGSEPQTQTEWVVDALTSQFVWGLVIGLLLAVVVARVSIWFETRQRSRIVSELCVDLTESICELIQDLDDNRHRNRNIDHEFLELISAEISVYGRNREHLVRVSDPKLRKDIQKFFNRVAAYLVQVQWHLRQYYEADRIAQSELAGRHLHDAHQACDRLCEMKDRGVQLAQRSKPH